MILSEVFIILASLTIASAAFTTLTYTASRALSVSDINLTGAIPPQPSLTTPYLATATRPFQIFPIHCFDPEPIFLSPAFPEDCEFVIDNIILRLATNPLAMQTWGFTDRQDINLSSEEHRQWRHGECVVFMRSLDRTKTDSFRVVDAALAAKKILQKCVLDSKLAKGGTADIGTYVDGLFIVLGGYNPETAIDDTGSPFASNRTVLSLSRNTERSMVLTEDAST